MLKIHICRSSSFSVWIAVAKKSPSSKTQLELHIPSLSRAAWWLHFTPSTAKRMGIFGKIFNSGNT